MYYHECLCLIYSDILDPFRHPRERGDPDKKHMRAAAPARRPAFFVAKKLGKKARPELQLLVSLLFDSTTNARTRQHKLATGNFALPQTTRIA
jgi:hypothetical protein